MDTGLQEGAYHDLSVDGSFGIIAAAHELKSPVALIRQLALSLEVATNEPSAWQQELLQRIVLTSERSLRLTENLTRSSALTSELFVTEPVNAQQLCEEVAHELSPLYAAYNREIVVDKRRSAPIVIANRDLLRRILLGFGDNALHYTDGKQATFQLARAQGKVRVGLRDYGPILPGNDRAARLRKQSVYRPASSGIGLSIAERFAQAMNSTLGTVRHRDGMTYFIQLLPSEQLRLL